MIHKVDMLLLRGPRKSGEMGTEELHKVQQISRPVPGEEHHKAAVYAGGHKGLAEKTLKILVNTKPDVSSEAKAQQMECWATLGRVSPTGGGGDSSPPLNPGEATYGALCPGLGTPVQERYRCTRKHSHKGPER